MKMTIVWGHNNFTIKTVLPSEIGILHESFAHCKFQLRQKYAHFFWIPFFSIGKMWVMIKPDGKEYKCPVEIRLLLEEAFPYKTSAWAFTGSILIIGTFILYNLCLPFIELNRKHNIAASNAKINFELLEKVKNAVRNDYFLFNVKESGEHIFSYNKIPLKVLRVEGDIMVLGNLASTFSTAATVNDIYEIVKAEIANKGISDSFKISKSYLRNAICNEFEMDSCAGIKINDFVMGGSCRLKEVLHVEGPILNVVYSDDKKFDGKYFEIINKGFEVSADSLVPENKLVTWNLSNERNLSFGKTIAIKCSGKGSAILYCSDKNKKMYQYSMESKLFSLTLKKIEN